MSCPRCQATHFIKYGYVNNVQRHRCKNCHYQWTRTTPHGYPPEQKRLAVVLYCHGISMNAISKLFSVNASCVLRWIWKFAKTHAQKPEVSNTQAVTLELDEMWHSLGKKENKLWIWKAFDRNTGCLIDCECGGRDKQTLSKLVNRLSAFNVETYYTDNWQVYESVLPASKHVQTKAETHRIERNNCLMRHWFGRFKRKSIIVSKSVEMVEITIALFARFRVNGNVFDILNIADKTQVNTII